MDALSGNFSKGISKITPEGNQQNNTYLHAYGLMLDNEARLVNIDGIGRVTSLPEGVDFIGGLTAGSRLYLWLGSGVDSQIGYVDNDLYNLLYKDAALNFNNNYKIKADNISEKIICWTDDLNPIRYMNTDTISSINSVQELELSLPTRFYEYYIKIRDGGNLPSGKFFYTYAYVTESGTETNYMIPSQEIDIHDVDFQSLPLVQNASYVDSVRSKRLIITHAQTDQRYAAIQPAVLYYATDSHQLKASVLPKVSIVGRGAASIDIVISTLANGVEVDPLEILLQSVQYDQARTLKVYNNTLFLGGAKNSNSIDSLVFQEIANSVGLDARIGVSQPKIDLAIPDNFRL